MTADYIGPNNRFFYGWISLSGLLLGVLVFAGIFVYVYPVYLPILCDNFGWSRTAVSTAYSIGLLMAGLTSPLAGYFITRFGPKLNLVLGTLLGSLALVGMTFVNELWHVYLLWGIIGLGVCFGGFIAGTAVVNNWFIRKRSLALGLYVAAVGLGGFIFPPLTTSLIDAIGWRMTWLVMAGLNLVLSTVICSLIMVKNRPEDIGQAPDGRLDVTSLSAGEMERLTEVKEKPKDWQTKQALRQPATWYIAAFGAASYFALGVQQAHQITYIQDLGFSPMVAAMTMSILSVMSILGSLLFGLLALKVDIRYSASAFLILRIISLIILLTTHNLTLIYIYTVIFGLSAGILSPVMAALIANYYGRDCYAAVLGVAITLQVLSWSASPTIAGAIYDATHTYTLAFKLSIISTFIGMIFVLLARQPKWSPPNIQ
jgi:MFS family permease